MEFHVRLQEAGVDVDVDAVTDCLVEVDPAAVADQDAGGILRLATSVDEHEIARVLAEAGYPVHPEDVVRQPSVCCGSCSG